VSVTHPLPAAAPAAATPPARVLVVECVYYQEAGRQPVLTESRYESPCQTKGRREYELAVGTEWVPLLPEGSAPPGVIHLANGEKRCPGRAGSVPPRTVWLASAGAPPLLLPPGESMRLRSLVPRGLRLRCSEGEAKVLVTLFPE
jgi:hypothetical protein